MGVIIRMDHQKPLFLLRFLSFFCRVIKKTIVAALIVSALLMTILAGVATQEAGTQWLWRTTTYAVKYFNLGVLSARHVSGTLYQGLALKDLYYQTAGDAMHQGVLQVNQASGQWQLEMFPLSIHITSLYAERIEWHAPQLSKPSQPLIMPKHLALPFALTVDLLRADHVQIFQACQEKKPCIFSMEAIEAAVEWDHVTHHLELKKALIPEKFNTHLRADLSVQGKAPFKLSGYLSAKGKVAEHDYSFKTDIKGDLNHVAMRARLSGQRGEGHAEGVISPFNAVPIKEANVEIIGINPRQWVPTLPEAYFRLNGVVKPVFKQSQASEASHKLDAVSGRFVLRNEKAGVWDQQRIPVEVLQGQLAWHEGEIHLQEWTAHLFKAGKVIADVSLKPLLLKSEVKSAYSGWNMKAHIQTKDVNTNFIDSRLKASAIQLMGDIKGDWRPADLKQALRFTVESQLTLDKSQYATFPMKGLLALHLTEEQLLPSTLQLNIAGNDVSAQGKWHQKGNVSDQISVLLKAPALDRLGLKSMVGLGGALDIDAKLTGGSVRPRLVANYHVAKFSFAAHRVEKMSGDLSLDIQRPALATSWLAWAPSSTLAWHHELLNYASSSIDKKMPASSSTLKLGRAQINLEGTLAHHVLNVTADGVWGAKPQRVQTQVIGALSGMGSSLSKAWQGTIQQLNADGAVQIHVVKPVPVQLSASMVSVGEINFEWMKAQWRLKQFSYDKAKGYLRSVGTIQGIAVQELLALQKGLSGQPVPFQSDMLLDSAWDILLNPVLPETAKGFWTLQRRTGDIRYYNESELTTNARGETHAIALGMKQFSIRADISPQGVQAHALSDSVAVGVLEANAHVRLIQGWQHAASWPVTGKLVFTFSDIQSLAGWLDPSLTLGGRIEAHASCLGTLGQPQLSGYIQGEKLQLGLLDQGIHLHNGGMRLVLDRNRINLENMKFSGGDGYVHAAGHVALNPLQGNASHGKHAMQMNIKVKADHLNIYADPKKVLVLSGQALLANKLDGLGLDGDFYVDKGLFDLPKSSAPKLGDDVVVISSSGKEMKSGRWQARAKPAPSQFPLYVKTKIDLGERFRFKGSDADVLLAGDVTLKKSPQKRLEGFGTVQVVEGTYEVFGKKMMIEKGDINFQGALDNPTLRIVAMRRGLDVEAGVLVTGTARQLRATLVSEPSVSDEEKISWLLLGHGTENTELGQRQAVTAALGALANAGSRRIAKGIGLDDFSIASNTVSNTGSTVNGSKDNVEQQVVSLGKALSEKFYLGYEQSLDGATRLVKATWRLSKRWSVIIKAGAVNSLDLLFNKRFDDSDALMD